MRERTQKKTEPALVGTRELARYLGRGRNRLYGAIHRGEIPGVIRLGGRWYVRRPALEAWLHDKNGHNTQS